MEGWEDGKMEGWEDGKTEKRSFNVQPLNIQLVPDGAVALTQQNLPAGSKET